MVLGKVENTGSSRNLHVQRKAGLEVVLPVDREVRAVMVRVRDENGGDSTGPTRNRRSEHATANAIDISGFRLADGTRISVRRDWNGERKKSQFLRAVHQRACGYFRVALSPDFNRAHHDHFHFDRGFLWTCR